MKFFSENSKLALQLLNKSFSYLKAHPRVGFYGFLVIVNTLFCFTIFFLFEYHVYGIHLFDITTLTNFSPLSIFDHIWHGVSILGIILFSICSSLMLHAMLTYQIVTTLDHSPKSALETVTHVLQHFGQLFVLTIIFFNYHVIMLFDVISISPFLSSVQNSIEGQEKGVAHTVSKATPGRLIVPLLLTDHHETFKTALLHSRDLIEKKLGTAQEGVVNFTWIKIAIFTAALSAIVASTYFDEIDTLATSFIAGILTLTLLKIIEIGLITYHACLYAYCTDGNAGPFTPEELKLFL